MGARVSRTDFEWVYTEEPHATRRKEILAKYPEMKKLMGSDPNLKYLVALMVILQLMFCYTLRDHSWSTILIFAYILGGTVNHSLSSAIHEMSHNLAFGHNRPLANKLFGLTANLPIGLPFSVSFKKYHLDHHRYQGDEKRDVDIASDLETRLFNHTLHKFVWVILQLCFYVIRPLLVNPKPLSMLEIVNLVIQISFDIIIYKYLGFKALAYLIIGTFMATGLHPMAGHLISEHYVFVKGYETYSYYGPLNWLTWNVGYHNEHHDFPSIPGSRLPEVRKIAPEYYDNLPCHHSWVKVIWDFIFDPEIGPYARVKRRAKRPEPSESVSGLKQNHDTNGNGGPVNGNGINERQ